jgi:hypothetical protein
MGKTSKELATKARYYAYSVIVSGGVVFALTFRNSSPNPRHFLIYFVLAVIASMVKFRLPGVSGTYSASFLVTLIGIVGFTLPETLAASCAGALVQSVWRAKERPSVIQLLFNMANLVLSISLCFLVAHAALAYGLEAYRPAVLALVTALHFFTSTILVSGVLALLQGKPIRQVCQEWYLWFLPYYLIGAVVVGLLPLFGRFPAPEGWLMLAPLLYLVHFFYVVSNGRRPLITGEKGEHGAQLPYTAQFYVDVIITAGAILLIYGVSHWQSQDPVRFLGYLAMALVAATFKVRLPGLRSTISVTFVVFLVAILELNYPEAVSMAAVVTVVQTVWRTKRTPQPVQIAFNSACMVLSVSGAFIACRILTGSALTTAIAPLVIATVLLYSSNTLIVAAAMCMAERKPLSTIWQQCYFWSFPYYAVGASVAALMIAAARSVGWQLSLAAFPVLVLVYASYRLHTNAESAASVV